MGTPGLLFLLLWSCVPLQAKSAAVALARGTTLAWTAPSDAHEVRSTRFDPPRSKRPARMARLAMPSPQPAQVSEAAAVTLPAPRVVVVSLALVAPSRPLSPPRAGPLSERGPPA